MSTDSSKSCLFLHEDGKCRAVLAGHQDNVRALSVTHDGLLASASDDNTIKLWNLQTGHCIRTMIGHQDAVRGRNI